MQVDLTEKEIEAISIDLSRSLRNILISGDEIELKNKILVKLKEEYNKAMKLRINPKPTLKELTQMTEQWIKDNGIVVGDKFKINSHECEDGHGKVGLYGSVCGAHVIVNIDGERFGYKVDKLEPYKEEYIPFDFEDRGLFRGKWLRFKRQPMEAIAYSIDKDGLIAGSKFLTYKSALEEIEFIDGTPFGKLK